MTETITTELRRVVVIGLGGLGCPALWALADCRDIEFALVDDDVVDESNLGRQVLFGDRDIGTSKLEAAQRRLIELGVAERAIVSYHGRLVPNMARDIVRGASVVLEGADNYATKFLCADACFLEGVPVVHGAALGWQATVFSVSARGTPCYRCLFEDIPTTVEQNCSTAGVMGPVTGIAGALMADRALARLASVPSEQPVRGEIWSFDGKKDLLRRVEVSARADCPLCGPKRTIFAVDEDRYKRQTCAA